MDNQCQSVRSHNAVMHKFPSSLCFYQSHYPCTLHTGSAQYICVGEHAQKMQGHEYCYVSLHTEIWSQAKKKKPQKLNHMNECLMVAIKFVPQIVTFQPGVILMEDIVPQAVMIPPGITLPWRILYHRQ